MQIDVDGLDNSLGRRGGPLHVRLRIYIRHRPVHRRVVARYETLLRGALRRRLTHDIHLRHRLRRGLRAWLNSLDLQWLTGMYLILNLAYC